MRSTSYIFLAALLGTVAASGAHAETTNTGTIAVEEETAMDASPVGDSVLSESRGAFSPTDLLNINNNYLNGNSSNNVNIGGVTGNNQINGGSFTNTQGLVNVIQNSGNNVLIQSSTIVNMTMIGK